MLGHKKATFPVVSTALLIVVSVFAVIGYCHFALLRSVHFEQAQRVSKLVQGDLNV